MLSQPNLLFLREKILDLKNAIFISQHSSLLKMATTIVSIEKMDELGQLWFFVLRPQQALHEFDREFPVRLEFFRKGRDFFLHASGKAFIVTDPEDINGLLDEDIREKADDRLVLIKVRITKAEYFHPRPSGFSIPVPDTNRINSQTLIFPCSPTGRWLEPPLPYPLFSFIVTLFHRGFPPAPVSHGIGIESKRLEIF